MKKKIKDLTYNDICSLCSNYPHCVGCPLSFNHVCNGFDREENEPKLIFTTNEQVLNIKVKLKIRKRFKVSYVYQDKSYITYLDKFSVGEQDYGSYRWIYRTNDMFMADGDIIIYDKVLNKIIVVKENEEFDTEIYLRKVEIND